MAIDTILQNLSANLASTAIKDFIQQRMNKSIVDFKTHALSEKEYSELECYMEMLVSIWSHAVYADNEYQEEEEDLVYYFFKYLFVEQDPANNTNSVYATNIHTDENAKDGMLDDRKSISDNKRIISSIGENINAYHVQ